jgi:heme a synthase
LGASTLGGVDGHTTAVARARGFALTPPQFRRLALAELGALWLIVGTGAAVRLTDSGLGCRHWPGCERGHPLPAKDYHAYVEFGNRLVGGVVIALTLLAWLGALRTGGLGAWARRLAFAVFVGALLQAPLGYLAVRSDLKWPIVMAHLLLSILLLAGAVVLALEARGLEEGHAPPLVPRDLRRLGVVFTAACLVLLVSGMFATAAGPHSGGGEHIDRFASLRPTVYAHAAVVAVFVGTFLFSLGYLAARRERSPRLFAVGSAVLVLLLAQMAIGEVQWRTHLPWGVVLVHVVLAAAVWAGTVALATLFLRPLRSFAPNVGWSGCDAETAKPGA